jgi:hypothetical protein
MTAGIGLFVDPTPKRQAILNELRAAATGGLGLGPLGNLDAYTRLLYPHDSIAEARTFARYRDGSFLWVLRLLEKLGIQHPRLRGSRLAHDFRPESALVEIAHSLGAWIDLRDPFVGAWAPWPTAGHLVVFGRDPGHAAVILDEDALGLLVSIDAGQEGEPACDDDRVPDGSIQVVRRRLVRRAPGLLQAFHPRSGWPGRPVVGVVDVVGLVMGLRPPAV